MGWTGTHREKGITNKEWFEKSWAEGYEQVDIASGSINRNNVYVALRKPDGNVIGVVILTRWSPKEYFNFMEKSVSEDMGPREYDMPKRIYDLLSPLEEVYPDADFEADSSARWAKEWREKIEAFHEKMANRVKLSDGLRVKVPYDLNFGNWTLEAGQPFVVMNAKRKHFARSEQGYMFRLRKSTLYDLELA
jgi:hypothetical protein